MADVVGRLEATLSSPAHISSKLREHVQRIDQYMADGSKKNGEPRLPTEGGLATGQLTQPLEMATDKSKSDPNVNASRTAIAAAHIMLTLLRTGKKPRDRTGSFLRLRSNLPFHHLRLQRLRGQILQCLFLRMTCRSSSFLLIYSKTGRSTLERPSNFLIRAEPSTHFHG
jgi:hypothetical protein